MFCWCSQQWRGLPLEWLLQHLLMPFIAQLSKAFRARTAPREKGLAYQSYGSHRHQIPLLCLDHGGSRRHFDLTLYDSSSPGGGDPGLCVHDEDLREPLVRRQGSQVSMRVPNLPLGLRGKAGGCARVTAGPKRPHLGVCPGPNFPLQSMSAASYCKHLGLCLVVGVFSHT